MEAVDLIDDVPHRSHSGAAARLPDQLLRLVQGVGAPDQEVSAVRVVRV